MHRGYLMSYLLNMTVLVLIVVAALPLAAFAVSPSSGQGLAASISEQEAWGYLPKSLQDDKPPLPSWARMLASELPRSTAALLQLDIAQRTKSPVDPKLRAAMRWVAAHANRCPYGLAYATADARRAGLTESKLQALDQPGYPGWPDDQRAALEFAHTMTVDSDSVTDEEFARLVHHFGEKQAASMVLLLAYANFQDRLLLCLDAPIEFGGPIPPSDYEFDPASFVQATTPPPATPKPALAKAAANPHADSHARWSRNTYEILQDRLENQRRKPTRLRIPEWNEVAANLPDGLIKRPSDIVWYRICFGYAPELAVPFEYFMRTAGAETNAKWDRIFGQSLFWVTTEAIKCPYCMGHCEMNWEVAGLTKTEIADRSRLLASEDWSSFSPAEQHAFAFARKLTKTPWAISDNEIEGLKNDFGADRALIVALNASRYHYMTRISNGFQLKLERENVFYEYYNTASPSTTVSDATAVPLLSDEECWKRLPTTVQGGGQILPSWAKAAATHLPRTTAAMLELDLAQRTLSPLDPALRAKMRWVIARENRCGYSEAYALADLERAADPAARTTLVGDPKAWPESDREPLEFVRLLTVAASTIDDDLFARLRERFGEKQVAAMVLLAAYGNFQDRIILGWQLSLAPQEPLPPLAVEFGPGAFQATPILPPQQAIPELTASGTTVVDLDPEWSELSYAELQSRLENQRERSPRLPIPTWDQVKLNLPKELAARPTRIIWNLVCSGYVPELAIPWSICTRTMWAESPQDRILEESLFWVQTRSIRCNYCMGHCEMLLEVAGLDKSAVAERTRLLAGDDWSSFPPPEQRAFAFARKLTKTPWELTREDYRTLQADFGPEQAMGIFWWLCRGLYMTRVSDGFQLPLERDNVFADFYKPKSPDTVAASQPQS